MHLLNYNMDQPIEILQYELCTKHQFKYNTDQIQDFTITEEMVPIRLITLQRWFHIAGRFCLICQWIFSLA